MTLEELLKVAKTQKASDLLIMVGDAPAIRVAGHWDRIAKEVIQVNDMETMCRSIMSAEAFAQIVQKREMDFCHTVQGVGRVRCNLHYQRDHLAMVLRMVWPEIPPADTLGIPRHALEMANTPHGLILISGPTGSGKSTTLAAMVEHINHTRRAHVITLEDPVEFIYTNKTAIIEQREIGSDTHTWHDGLRSILRQAPDIIVLGELRDLESIQIALLAAETGHLVIASVHSSTAHGAIMRMVDVFPANQIGQIQVQISQSLRMVFAQQLMPSKTPGSRVLAYEILMSTSAIQNLIRNSEYEQIPNMISAGRNLGMISFSQCVQELVSNGMVPAAVNRGVHGTGGTAHPPLKIANGRGR